MQEGILIAFAAYLATAILFIALSIPLIMRKIPRNKWYGFRFKKALSSDDVWYKVNRFGGWLLLWSGILTAIMAVALAVAPAENLELYISIATGGILVETTILIVAPLIYLNRLTESV